MMIRMVNRNLLRELDAPEEGSQPEAMSDVPSQPAAPDALVTGRVVRVTDREVWIDIGAKSPGVVRRGEWERDAPPAPGDAVEVLVESAGDEDGVPRLSHRKARFDRQWREFIDTRREGDTVSATVTAQVAGGLRVDIGVPAFLPASQVDIRRPADLAAFVGTSFDCKILTINRPRRSVVVTRRAILRNEDPMIRRDVLAEFEPGQVRTGVVKTIAPFGAFVDLGGIDGLLSITEMSWERVHNPADLVRIDETIEVVVLAVDRDRGRISLSLKHKTPNPWLDLADRFPAGSRHAGEVVRVLTTTARVQMMHLCRRFLWERVARSFRCW
jgi:small subunit ribosomal protein S1